MSGFDPQNLAASDAGVLIRALGRTVTADAIAAVSPFRFEPPLPPTVAAQRADRTLYFRDVVATCRKAMAGPSDFLLIEGVGGVMSPIAEGAKVLDLIAELEIPALLVCGSYVGAASHALTALAVLDARNIEVIGLVVNESEHTVITLAEAMGLIVPFANDRKILGISRNSERADTLAEFVLD
jgi:dethiobiotin synthetase